MNERFLEHTLKKNDNFYWMDDFFKLIFEKTIGLLLNDRSVTKKYEIDGIWMTILKLSYIAGIARVST